MKNKLIFAAFVVAIIVFGLIWVSGPSKEERTAAEDACKTFIAEEMNAYTDNEAGPKVFDTYTKKGKIVVKVGYKVVSYMGRDKSYSVRLCVVDKEKGTISSPSPLNDNEWRN